MTRGSRKHVLDWTSRPSFPMEFSEFVSLADCALADPPVWQPRATARPTRRAWRIAEPGSSPARLVGMSLPRGGWFISEVPTNRTGISLLRATSRASWVSP
jgi:hypothetical protein